MFDAMLSRTTCSARASTARCTRKRSRVVGHAASLGGVSGLSVRSTTETMSWKPW